MDQDILQQILSLVKSIDARLAAVEAREPVAAPIEVAVEVSAEQLRQSKLYAELAAKLDFSDVDPAKFPDYLMHPDLLLLSTAQRALRAAGGIEASTMYRIAEEDRIAWHGGLIRADGGQGLFATQAQADAWDDRVQDGTSIGPG